MMFARLRKLTKLTVNIMMQLDYGCLVQTIVKTYGLDERTVVKLQKAS
jgi:hypothetical protein